MKVIILAGGGGTRLFPLSRSCFPKQFLHIAGKESLLEQTVERFIGLVKPEDIVIVTNEFYLFHVKAEMEEIGTSAVHIICEPVGRNTAPAIALASVYCRDVLGCPDDEVMFVCPSDHLIETKEDFQKLVKEAVPAAQKGFIVTLGIVPTKPETGYGYIHATEEKVGPAFKVESFTEKPNKETAEKYIQEGHYYWNGGMFMFRMDTMKQEMQSYIPEILDITGPGYDNAEKHFEEMPDISIDYAVAEKSERIAVVPMSHIYWNDIGSFDSISDVMGGENQNSFDGDVVAEDCRNTMILGSNRLITGIGLSDLMVVDTPDVLLVAKKGESQKVKQIVQKLKDQKRKEVSENVTMYRPWGSYTVIAEGDGFKAKRIVVKPGGKLSLQMHYHRSEHWIVISGTGKITLGDKQFLLRENESTFIPIGTKHRLENPGRIPLAVIEVQNGKYLGEDDIVRFEDIYGRVK